MFQNVPVEIPAYVTLKRLESRFKPPQTSGECLDVFRALVVNHEAKDDRFMMWLAETCANAILADYVATEGRIVHFSALGGYAETVAEERVKLARLETEWRILATLAGYFKAAHMEGFADGVKEFFNRTYPKKKS